MTGELAMMWLKSTDSYKAFDKARRESVRKALREAIREGATNDPVWIDAATDKHLDAVCEAGLPILKILKLVGAAQLMRIATLWQASPEEKKA